MCFAIASIPFFIGAILMPGYSLLDRVGFALVGVMFLFGTWSIGGSGGKIDVSIKNKIIGYDGQGRYLVKANSIWNIHGPHTSSKYNLPASITNIGKGLYVVDRTNTTFGDDARNIQFKQMDGDWHIQPRGQDRPVSDMMVGFDHQYTQRD